MKASELKKRYPVMWDDIEGSVLHDIKCQSDGCRVKVPDGMRNAIAHNAAFRAVLFHHEIVS